MSGLPAWLEAAHDGAERSSSQALMAVISELNSLLRRGAFGDLDLILAKADPDRMSPEMIVAFLRSTAVAKERSPSWGRLLIRARASADRRGLPARLFMGLQPPSGSPAPALCGGRVG